MLHACLICNSVVMPTSLHMVSLLFNSAVLDVLFFYGYVDFRIGYSTTVPYDNLLKSVTKQLKYE